MSYSFYTVYNLDITECYWTKEIEKLLTNYIIIVSISLTISYFHKFETKIDLVTSGTIDYWQKILISNFEKE